MEEELNTTQMEGEEVTTGTLTEEPDEAAHVDTAGQLRNTPAPEWLDLQRPVYQDFPIEVRRNRTSGSDVENRATITLATQSIDRYETQWMMSGARLDNWRKNPVVLINHDHNLLAANGTVSVQNDQLVANVMDDAWDHDDPMIERWFRKFKRGMLKAASIGAQIHDWEWALRDPEGDPDDFDNRFVRFTDWELLEFSFVVVPGQPEALVTQRQVATYYQDRMNTALLSSLRSPVDRSGAAGPDTSDANTEDPASEPDNADVEAPRSRRITEADYDRLLDRLEDRIETRLKRRLGKC